MSPVISIADVLAHYKGVAGRNKVYKMIHAKHLHASLINGRFMVTRASVEALDRKLQSNESFELKDAEGETIIKKTAL